MQSDLMEGNGLRGGSIPSADIPFPPPPPPVQRPGRRQTDIEAIEKMHSLETQMAVVETQITHLGERLEETQRELKEDIDKLDERISNVTSEVKRLLDEHTVDERISNEAKFAKLNENFDAMQRKADARHQSLREISDTLTIIKGGAVKAGLFVIVGGFTFTVSAIGYIITHIDTINRVIDNLTKVP